MRTRPASALAETVALISTLCGGSLGRPGAVLRSLNSLPFAVHIGAITSAVHLACVRIVIGRGGRVRARLRLVLRLGNDLVRKQNRRKCNSVDELARGADGLHSPLPRWSDLLPSKASLH